MKIGVPRETARGERRVAVVPDSVPALAEAGCEVFVESRAGEEAGWGDDAYRSAGASVREDGASVLSEAGVVLKVNAPDCAEAALLGAGSVLISFLAPEAAPHLVALLTERRVTALSMNRIPRITRAQPMDALSSQSTVAGYKAALLAADALGKVFPLLMTAAGTLAPAKVLVVGAGVAGLQAIATARRLGAVVTGFDVRAAAREEVESLGARFVGVDLAEETEDADGYARSLSEAARAREEELLRRVVPDMDVVITTALVPGRVAPKLLSAEAVRAMRPGSVIVDLAAESGGNCGLSEPGRAVVRHGVRILAPENLPATVPVHASQMYSRNVTAVLLSLIKDGALVLDLDDPIVDAVCVTHGGEARGAR